MNLKRLKKIFARLAAAAVLMVSIALILLPTVIRHEATNWLHEHGAKEAKIWNVDLNILRGRFSIDGLNAGDGLKIGHLECNIDWWPMTRGQLSIRTCEMDHARFTLKEGTDGRWLPAGLNIPPSEPTANGAETGSTPSGEASGKLPLLPVLHTLDLKNIELQIEGKSLHLKLPLEYLTVHLKALQADGSQQLATSLQIGPATFSQGSNTMTEDGMFAEAEIDLPYPDATLPEKLAAQIQSMHFAGTRLSGSGEKLAGFGKLDLGKATWQAGVLNIGTIKLGDIVVQKSLTQTTDVTADSLTLNDLVASQDKGLRLSGLGIDNLSTKDKGSHAVIGHLKAAKVSVSPKADVISLASLDLSGVDFRLLREKDGQFDLPAAPSKQVSTGNTSPAKPTTTPAKAAEPAPSAAPSPASAAAPIKLSVGRIDLAAGSQLSFRDESAVPPFETGLTVEKFNIMPIHLPASEPTHLDIKLKTGEQGNLTIQGDVVADAANPTANLDVHLQGMDMAQLSGYVENHFGQAIQTGQMNVKSSIKIAKRNIDAHNHLTLRKLELAPAGDKPGGDTAALGMPVDMALDMLRDGKGDISIKVPVSGKLDDPNVNVNDAINQALMSALQAGALQYAAQFLQPYGSLITVAKLAGKVAAEASKPHLTPIGFAGQSSDLSPDMQSYTDKIAALLKAKPFRLDICGVATRAEAGPDPKAGMPRTLDDEALLKLAAKRSVNVIQRLTDQGIAGDRLFHCRDRIDDSKKASPRAELVFD